MNIYKNKLDDELVEEMSNATNVVKQNMLQLEMMRRLKDSINKFDKNTEDFGKRQMAMAFIMLIVAMAQIVVSVFLSGISPWAAVLIEVIIVIFIGYWAKRISQDLRLK
ncbi:MAG: hypothetical protein UW30_C0011G0024 [Candidatus Giovannonibacteria bacterium GW2011_GWA2_44_13b]|uniref:Uncharacterized protein n=2 Tax=Candidatus Giovannoniibacteriota TaxID=1752738 RepID=A0A0G1H3V6_9BACT|nr:MAG: hypothetical protein UW30_C0011G0024 [Candidatus Giovannonibacteria bacterium GW2011_GWA2_44_13b]OGF82081.1 MAG: hypothetical protein A2924_01955 [Candidatus Giovannonibacteria bacterium RIFCSPLOWO2_01_FULL_44_16]